MPYLHIDECEQIEAYVMENHAGRIHGIVGLSLGGTIAVSVLSRGKIQIERTVLDAAFCVDMGILRDCCGWFFPKGASRVRDGKFVPGFLIDLLMGRGNRSMVEMIYPGSQSRPAGQPAGMSIPIGSPVNCEVPLLRWSSGVAPGSLIRREVRHC